MEQSQINNYRIEDYLGSGGFSEVWLGVNVNTNEKAALKIIEKKLALNQKFRERFKHSSEVLKQLSHENIVKIIELIDSPDHLALVMEYIDGVNLEDFILKNYDPATPLKLLPFFLQILDALDYSHRHKIIHRDVKPSNILINRQLVAKLIDFDTIKDFSHDANFTSANFMIGTFTYISPEQLEDSRNVSPQSDIYSMGMVLFYLLIGRPFFDKSQKESVKDLANRIINENLPKLNLLNKNIPPVFDAIISKATEKDAGKRFKNCAEFKHHLLEQLNPYSVKEDIDLDKTQMNVSPKRNNMPPPQPTLDEDKTSFYQRPEETYSDRTQFFKNEKASFTTNEKSVNPDTTAFFESEHTAIFEQRKYRVEDEKTRVFNKESKSFDSILNEEIVSSKKLKRSLPVGDIIILIGGIIMFIIGMFFLYVKLNK